MAMVFVFLAKFVGGFHIMMWIMSLTARIAGEVNVGSLDTRFFLLLLSTQTPHPCKP